MKLTFLDMEHVEVLDRFFFHLYKFYPYIVSITIKGDDTNHELPFLTEEDRSRTITFLKHAYHNNSELHFWLLTDVNDIEVFLNADNLDHILEFNYDFPEPVFQKLHPFSIEMEGKYYYSTDCGMESENGFWLLSDEIIEITESMRENYKFTNFCLNYYNKFDFLRLNEDLYTYNFRTFLPENISRVDLARLIIFLIAKKTKHYQLLNIKKEHQLNVSLEELEEQTVLNFAFDKYPVAGYISPMRKHISVVF